MFDISSLKNILPSTVFRALDENLNAEKLQEVRLRGGSPVRLLYDGRAGYLTPNGISESVSLAIIARPDDVPAAVIAAAEHSVYAYNDDIVKGYVTLQSGVRIGVCGEIVSEGGKIVTIKNFSSVNIRIPHEITDCARSIMPDIVSNNCRVMIVSPPGAGKTTMLRDIARQLSDNPPHYNVLIADERNEISCTVGGKPQMNVGVNTDVISGSTKEHTFECAIRSMRPDVIITDEIFGQRDADIIKEAVGSGIAVIASAHATDADTLSRRAFFRTIKEERLFERYYFLSASFGKGHVACVRDGALEIVNDR